MKVAAFGGYAGSIWSLAPLALSDLWWPPAQTLTVVVTGAIAGALLATVLAGPLRRWPSLTLFWALLTLPAAAFLFGVLLSVFQLSIKEALGLDYRFAHGNHTSIEVGVGYVQGLRAYFVGLVLLPIAIWTTYQLKTIVDDASPQNPSNLSNP
jgi:hypothetical protein